MKVPATFLQHHHRSITSNCVSPQMPVPNFPSSSAVHQEPGSCWFIGSLPPLEAGIALSLRDAADAELPGTDEEEMTLHVSLVTG